MKISKTRQNLSLLIFGLFLIGVIFGITQKQFNISVGAASSQDATASSDSSMHYISIFDGDDEKTVRSDASTVREALERADVQLADGDIVEPGLDEQINEENFNINIYRARNVVVIDGYVKKYIKTAATNPIEVAKAAGVELATADQVEIVPYDGFLESGMTNAYRVVRAKTVKFNYYGKYLEVRTQAATVGDFLKEQNIARDQAKNWISLADDTVITDGINLAVYYQGKRTVTVDEDIAFDTKTTYDYSVDYGKTQVTQAGVIGKKTVTYELEMKDGKEISRSFISEIITTPAVEQQVVIGMKINLPSGSHEDWMAAAGISSSDYGYVNYIVSHESGWRTTASNGKYYGLYQTSLGRLQAACPNWQNDPICQLRSATSYAVGRYGSWQQAYEFWNSHRWW